MTAEQVQWARTSIADLTLLPGIVVVRVLAALGIEVQP